jgi:tRNA (cytidine/uridine-2'-O-)-methyltransferase
MFHIVLVEPEIPPNTGNIARLCAATRTRLHLVGPLGFRLDDKALQRAGMDYWHLVDHRVWDSWAAFAPQIDGQRAFFLSSKARLSVYDTQFQDGDYLVFGRETKGLPESLLAAHADSSLRIPMAEPAARCLNLATSAGIVLYEALRQTRQL